MKDNGKYKLNKTPPPPPPTRRRLCVSGTAIGKIPTLLLFLLAIIASAVLISN